MTIMEHLPYAGVPGSDVSLSLTRAAINEYDSRLDSASDSGDATGSVHRDSGSLVGSFVRVSDWMTRHLSKGSPEIRESSQMPRHLISDAHEWINEIPAVPIYYLAKPQPRERAWQN